MWIGWGNVIRTGRYATGSSGGLPGGGTSSWRSPHCSQSPTRPAALSDRVVENHVGELRRARPAAQPSRATGDHQSAQRIRLDGPAAAGTGRVRGAARRGPSGRAAISSRLLVMLVPSGAFSPNVCGRGAYVASSSPVALSPRSVGRTLTPRWAPSAITRPGGGRGEARWSMAMFSPKRGSRE
jgi:hypothetical protein